MVVIIGCATDIAAVQNPDGTPLMFVSIQTDITSQRKKY